MKKSIAMALLALLLFSQGGYMLLFQYFIYHSDSVIEDHINRNLYKESDLVEIKIPVQLPSAIDWDDYQTISGQVQLSGNCYNYVKLKITRDTMFLMVIPNHEKTRLIDANIICAKNISDVPLNKKSHSSTVKRSGIDEFNYTTLSFHTRTPKTVSSVISDFSFVHTVELSLDVAGQPPEVIKSLS